MSYDRSTDGSLMGWITQALGAKTDQEKANLQLSSGAFPRFDRVLAAALCKPEHLRSQFGVRFNAYLETCELQHEEIRGRVMLNVISREFDTDRNTGAIVTALELYNLPPPQDNIAALRQWRDKVNYVRNQIGPQDQPEPRLLAKWLYDRLKKHPAMRRHVDKVRDAPSGSEMQTFDWLWGKLDQCIHESQQEANAISIQEALRKGPPKKPSPSNDAPGMTAKAGKGVKDGKGKGKPSKDGKDGKGKSNPNPKHNSGGSNDQSKPSSTHPKTSELTPAQKAEMPCIYFSQGKCYREKCPFKHDPSGKGAAVSKAAPKSKPGPAKPGLVALLAASISAATATTIPSNSGPHFVDFVGDTGAGEWLGSRRAMMRQGVQSDVLNEWVGTSSKPLRFTTGGGTQPASSTIGIWSREFQQVNNIYLLDECPMVLSIGH